MIATKPEGIAIDWISRNIYWTDSQRDVIEVMKLDGTEQKVLINTDLVEPRGIVLHPELGKMYWSDWSRTNPKIEQANMDGTARQVMVSGGSLGAALFIRTSQFQCFRSVSCRINRGDCER